MGNPFKRFFEFIFSPSYSRTAGLLVILIIALSIPLTVFVAQRQQELRQRAEGLSVCEAEGGQCVVGRCVDQEGNFTTTSCERPTTTSETPFDFLKNLGGPKSASCMSESECISRGGSPVSDPSTCGDVIFRCEIIPSLPSCESQGGSCVQGPDACDRVGGTLTSGTCSSGLCCKRTPSCTDAGGRCVPRDACGAGVQGEPVAGTCSGSQVCCSLPSTPTPAPAAGGPPSTTAPVSQAPTTPSTTTTDPNQIDCNPPNVATCPQGYSPVQLQANNKWTCVSFTQHPREVPPICSIHTPTPTSAPFFPGSPIQNVPLCSAIGETSPKCPPRTTSTCRDGFEQCLTSDEKRFCSRPCPTAALPTCDTESTSSTCQAAANTCSGQGTRTRNLDRLSTGGQCTPKLEANVACTNAPANCSASTPSCVNGQCVATTPSTPSVFTNIFNLTLGLDGIGSTGDRKNPDSSRSNKNPRRSSRNIIVEAINTGLNQTVQKSGNVSYDPSTGHFKGSVDMGLLPTGNYTVKVKIDGYLKRKLLTSVNIVAGSSVGLESVGINFSLVTGNSDGDNRLSTSDYNNLLGCLFKPLQSTITFCDLADLDDNGVVDQFDYNLFLREISVVQDGD